MCMCVAIKVLLITFKINQNIPRKIGTHYFLDKIYKGIVEGIQKIIIFEHEMTRNSNPSNLKFKITFKP